MVVWVLVLVPAGCWVDPCESGFLYTPGGDAFVSMEEAANAAGEEGLVHVCPGTHELSEDIWATRPNVNGLRVVGDELDGSELILVGKQAQIFGSPTLTVQLENIVISDSEATGVEFFELRVDPETGFEYGYLDPFERDGEPEGGPEVEGNVRFVNVRFRDNRGLWGGGVEVVAGTYGEVTFESCTFERNEATEGSLGGAVAVVSDRYSLQVHGWEFAGSIVSIDTDWGSGDDDNVPEDITFAHTDSEVSEDDVYVDATYNFDGVASFTCDVATAVCE